MDTRTWLTNDPNRVVDGELATICVRLLGAWGGCSIPFILAAAGVWVVGRAEGLAIAVLGMPLFLYFYFVKQGIRVFQPANEKTTDSTLFLVLQIVLYAMFGIAFAGKKPIEWDLFGLFFSSIMILLQTAFVLIAWGSEVAVPRTMQMGLLVSIIVCAFSIHEIY